MVWRIAATVYATVFIAELGDKTQLATLLFAARADANRWLIFIAASAALMTASALGVIAGAGIAEVVSERTRRMIAGVGFIAIGLWTLIR